MTEQEINCAIAEAIGWTRLGFKTNITSGKGLLGSASHLAGTPPEDASKPEDDQRFEHIPNFHASLDACAEFEKFLDDTTGHLSVGCLIRNYWLTLMEILNPNVKLWDNGTFLGSWSHAIKVGEATAPQRCQAFLRVKWIWREG